MRQEKGVAHLIIIIVVLVAIVFVGGAILIGKDKNPISKFVPQFDLGPEGSGPRGSKNSAGTKIFDENGVTIVYVWPGGEKNIANEEAEIRVTNNGESSLEITDPYLTISTSKKVYDPASEGWESFDFRDSRDFISKIIIYQSIPESKVELAATDYGRLHYHFLFDNEYAQSSNHTATITFNLNIGGEIINIKEEVKRTVEPSSSYESDAANPVGDYFKDDQSSGNHN